MIPVPQLADVSAYQVVPEFRSCSLLTRPIGQRQGTILAWSSETLLDQDLGTVRVSGDPAALLDRLCSQVGRLDVVPADLADRNQRSALFKAIFLAFKAAGARDWSSNLVMALDHSSIVISFTFH
jgi:hypothetical protein